MRTMAECRGAQSQSPQRLMVLGLGLAVAAAAAPAEAQTDADRLGPVGQAILDMSLGGTATGVTGGMVFGDHSQWMGAAGTRDIAGNQPLAPTDQMRIGSQTKTYTGTVILQMVDEGLVSLDQTLDDWLPDLDIPNGDTITLRNAIGMTSGIKDYLDAPSIEDPSETILDQWNNLTDGPPYGVGDYTPEQLITQATLLSPEPIGEMNYSNTNFVILGLIAERASCTVPGGCSDIETLIQDRIIAPLELEQTHFPTDRDFTTQFSEGQFYLTTGAVDFTSSSPQVPWSAGAMLSSARDELIWVRELSENEFGLLTPETFRERITDTTKGNVAGIPAEYGYAIYYMPGLGAGGTLLGHSGAISGYTSSVFYDPGLDIAFGLNLSAFPALPPENFPNYLDPSEPVIASDFESFSTPLILFALQRAMALEVQQSGSCGPGDTVPTAGMVTCTGSAARTEGLVRTGGDLVVAASGQTIDGFDITSGTAVPIQTPRPAMAFFGSRQAAYHLSGGADILFAAGSLVEAYGAEVTVVELADDGASAVFEGTVRAFGPGSLVAHGDDAGGQRVWMTQGATAIGDIDLGGGGDRVVMDGTLTGDVMLNDPSSTLSGTGTVTGTVSDGMAQPGGSAFGTLTVGTWSPGTGGLEAEIGPDGAADLLAVTDTASVGSAALVVPVEQGADGTYVVLSAGTLDGMFASVSSIGGRGGVAAAAVGNDVLVTTVNPSFLDAGHQTAQLAFSRQFDAIDSRLGGAAATGAGTLGFQMAMAAGTVDMPSEAAPVFQILGAAASEPLQVGEASVWGKVSYTFGDQDGTGGAAGFDYDGVGVTAGLDYGIAPGWTGGVVFGFDRSEADVDRSGGTGVDTDTLFAGGHIRADLTERAFAQAAALVGRGESDGNRVTFSGGTRFVQSYEQEDWRLGFRATAGADFETGSFTITPRVSATLTHVASDGYTETGGSPTPLTVGDSDRTTARLEATVAARHDIALDEVGGGDRILTALGYAGLGAQEILDEGDTRVIAAGIGATTVQGLDDGQIYLPVGLSLEMDLGGGGSLFAGYDGEFGEHYTDHSVSGGLRLRF